MRGTFGVAYYLARGDLVATPSAVWIVTGASGFVGGHVLRELSDAERAVGLYRSAAPAGGRRVSSWTKDELRAALEGATGVVHSAAVVHRPGAPDDEYVRFNVDGTHALIEAARSVGVKRFVFMSSIKVHGEDLRGTIDENTPIAEESAYAATKSRAERIVVESADRRLEVRGIGSFIARTFRVGDTARLAAATVLVAVVLVLVNRLGWKPLQRRVASRFSWNR